MMEQTTRLEVFYAAKLRAAGFTAFEALLLARLRRRVEAGEL